MDNFTFYNPTKIHFGRGAITKISEEIPANTKVLITYGGGSIKKNGIFDQINFALANNRIYEFGGIEPNPEYSTLLKAVALIKTEKIEYIIAAGGGSVIDGTKFIAAASKLEPEQDAWLLIQNRIPVNEVMPFGAVLTLPATSSEMNHIGVISNYKTKEKFSFRDYKLFPKFAILDPETTYSLPQHQLANGIVDGFIHVAEQYLNDAPNAMVQDRFAESLMKIFIEEGPKAYKAKKPDYDTRANLMWATSWSLNTLLQMGIKIDFGTHKWGHELTALYGIDHARSLAVIFPTMLRLATPKRLLKMARFAEEVWGIKDGSPSDKAHKAIGKMIEFFQSFDISTRFIDNNVPLEAITIILERFEARGMIYSSKLEDVTNKDLATALNIEQKY